MSRIRTNIITNRMANGAPTVSNGLVVSGVTTTTSLNVTGNVSVGGTLTYEDVTNIDSVGMITARTDITLGDSIIHLGDTDTKMRFPADNTISFDTAGSERVRITTSGYVGINTNNPLNALEVLGKSSTTDTIAGVTVHEIARFNADTSEKFGLKLALDNTNKVFYLHRIDNGGDLAFSTRTGGVNYERLRITDDGKVGIGTNNPERTLDILGANCMIQLEGTGGSGREYSLCSTDSTTGAAVGAAGQFVIYDDTSGDNRLNIDSTGNIGINESSPDTKLHISASNNGVTAMTSANNRLRFTDTDTDVTSNQPTGTIEWETLDNTAAGVNAYIAVKCSNTGYSSMVFATGNTSTIDERLKIDQSGNMGLGTSPLAPGHKTLHIHESASGQPVRLQMSTNNTGTASNDGFTLSIDGSTSNVNIIQRETADMIFYTAGTERLRIHEEGYVSGNINVPCWFGSQDSQHNVGTAAWTTIINLGNSVVNPSFNNGGWNESTGIFTVQTGQAGYYFLHAGAGIDDVQDSDVVRVAFSKNDAAPTFFSEQRCIDQGANVVVSSGTITQVVQLAVGDTIKAQVYHNEGSTEPTEPNRCFFGGYRLSI